MTVLYRMLDNVVFDPETEHMENNQPYFVCYDVIRETRDNYVIRVDGKEKFVLKYARKCFAYTTKERARESYLIRKSWQVWHAQRSVELAKLGECYAKDKPIDEFNTYYR